MLSGFWYLLPISSVATFLGGEGSLWPDQVKGRGGGGAIKAE